MPLAGGFATRKLDLLPLLLLPPPPPAGAGRAGEIIPAHLLRGLSSYLPAGGEAGEGETGRQPRGQRGRVGTPEAPSVTTGPSTVLARGGRRRARPLRRPGRRRRMRGREGVRRPCVEVALAGSCTPPPPSPPVPPFSATPSFWTLTPTPGQARVLEEACPGVCGVYEKPTLNAVKRPLPTNCR